MCTSGLSVRWENVELICRSSPPVAPLGQGPPPAWASQRSISASAREYTSLESDMPGLNETITTSKLCLSYRSIDRAPSFPFCLLEYRLPPQPHIHDLPVPLLIPTIHLAPSHHLLHHLPRRCIIKRRQEAVPRKRLQPRVQALRERVRPRDIGDRLDGEACVGEEAGVVCGRGEEPRVEGGGGEGVGWGGKDVVQVGADAWREIKDDVVRMVKSVGQVTLELECRGLRTRQKTTSRRLATDRSST